MPEVSDVVLALSGFVVGWLSSPVQARWKGARSLKGALLALEDTILRAEYCLGTFSDKTPLAQLEADLERFRSVLIENPRLGAEYWMVYRSVFELSLDRVNFQDPFLRKTYSEVVSLQKRSILRTFFFS